MSFYENIDYHYAMIVKARKLPVGYIKRMVLINKAIQGILRAKSELNGKNVY